MKTLVIVLALLAVAAAGRAQIHVTGAELGAQGAVVHEASRSGWLDHDVPRKQETWLLDPAFTGPGHKWAVDYSLTRTRDGWPWYDSYVRIEVLSADGQCLGRAVDRQVHTTAAGALEFFGEAHEEARPHRIRFTFSQQFSFPYSFSARARVVPVTGANTGGRLREVPEFLAVGSADEPSWTTGDLVLTGEPHRFSLFSLRAGQELRMKLHGDRIDGGGAWIRPIVWDLGHRVVASGRYFVTESAPLDVELFRNTGTEAMFVIVGLHAEGRFPAVRIAYSSPQGASPTAEDPVAKPAAARLNPYIAVHRSVVSTDVPSSGGSTRRFELPASGEMVRFRLRILKVPFCSGLVNAGVSTYARVYSKSGALLADLGDRAAPHLGHEHAEFVYERDDSASEADMPGHVELFTRYDTSTVSLDATRYAKREGGDPTPPSVRLTSPAPGATLAGTVTLAAEASDDVAVAGLAFLVDGTEVGSLAGAAGSVALDSRTLSNGAHTFAVRATDAAGNEATSEATSCTVDNDLIAPLVRFVTPAAKAVLAGVATVKLAASDDRSGIAGVALRVDGVTVASGPGSASRLGWDTRRTADGAHRLELVATDGAGNAGVSAGRWVYVQNRPPGITTKLPNNFAWLPGQWLRVPFNSTTPIGFRTVQVLFYGQIAGSVTAPARAVNGLTSGRVVIPDWPIGGGTYHIMTLRGITVTGRVVTTTRRMYRF